MSTLNYSIPIRPAACRSLDITMLSVVSAAEGASEATCVISLYDAFHRCLKEHVSLPLAENASHIRIEGKEKETYVCPSAEKQ